MDKWYIAQGKNSDVVLSSRIRLARNLEDAPFPSRMSGDLRRTVSRKIFAALKNSELAGDLNLLDMSQMKDAEAQALVEKHLITSQFVNGRENGALILSNDETVSIMLCEEDHIRLQVMRSGQDLMEAYREADKIDDVLLKRLKIAFDDKLGFLTSSPTDLGTGLKASVLLHIPAIVARGQVGRLSAMVNKLGLSMKPVYSDKDAFYYLSNQITMGITEKSAVENLSAICDQIVKQERAAREDLKDLDAFEDRVYRAFGTLKMARKLTSSEFLSLISLVRLGVSLGYFEVPYETINALIIGVQRGNLTVRAGAGLEAQERDKLRASITREALGKY